MYRGLCEDSCRSAASDFNSPGRYRTVAVRCEWSSAGGDGHAGESSVLGLNDAPDNTTPQHALHTGDLLWVIRSRPWHVLPLDRERRPTWIPAIRSLHVS